VPSDLTMYLTDEPGELGRLGKVLGEGGVNIEGFCALISGGGLGEVHILVEDEAATFAALAAGGVEVASEQEVAVVEVEDASVCWARSVGNSGRRVSTSRSPTWRPTRGLCLLPTSWLERGLSAADRQTGQTSKISAKASTSAGGPNTSTSTRFSVAFTNHVAHPQHDRSADTKASMSRRAWGSKVIRTYPAVRSWPMTRAKTDRHAPARSARSVAGNRHGMSKGTSMPTACNFKPTGGQPPI
jgi:hypothetical protein